MDNKLLTVVIIQIVSVHMIAKTSCVFLLYPVLHLTTTQHYYSKQSLVVPTFFYFQEKQVFWNNLHILQIFLKIWGFFVRRNSFFRWFCLPFCFVNIDYLLFPFSMEYNNYWLYNIFQFSTIKMFLVHHESLHPHQKAKFYLIT